MITRIGHLKTTALAWCFACGAMDAGADWKTAQAGWDYQFPRDHGAHPDFKTEWWYFTGNLRDGRGREFGFQLTFFRHGIQQTLPENASRFMVRDLKFAHFAIADFGASDFSFAQKISRGAFGEAGSGQSGRLAWIDDWEVSEDGEGSFQIAARNSGRRLELRLATTKPPVIHGENGVSRKAVGEGRASHYYSFTRMRATGQLEAGGAPLAVSGGGWFDHEWATNQLAPGQVGWNWFSLQLDDGTELMLYQMRLRDGGIDPSSRGTFVACDGKSSTLDGDAFVLTPLAWWKSPGSGARYPIRWRLQIPARRFDAEISTPLEKQELVLEPISYWEGAVRIAGKQAGTAISGRGYMELTGYRGPLVGIVAPE